MACCAVIVKKILSLPQYRGRIELEVVRGAPRVGCVRHCVVCQHPVEGLTAGDVADVAAAGAGVGATAAEGSAGVGVEQVSAAVDGIDAGQVIERVVIEDDIFFFNASSLPDVAHNLRLSPFAHISDGLLDVLVLRSKHACKFTLRIVLRV